MLVIIITNRHEELNISASPVCAQSYTSVLLAIIIGAVLLNRVAVTPKLPTVLVVADSVTVLTDLIYNPAFAAGI